MSDSADTYKTILIPSEEILFKEKKSKFYGYAFPLTKEESVKMIIEHLRKKHPSANHVCYAWQIGVEKIKYRANDDGEPNNSAGKPIYGQIRSFGVTNILIAVVRIFGGTKLGVGGLISAYKAGAQLALENSKIIEKTTQLNFRITFDYNNIDVVMRTIKQRELEITDQKMNMNCELIVSVRKQNAEEIEKAFKNFNGVEIVKLS